MSRLPRPVGKVLAALCLLAGAPAPTFAAAVDLMPHRAVYDLSLAAARSGQTVTDVEGRMSFVWKDVCDGWSIDYRTRMQMFFGSRGGQEVSWTYSAWEADDGQDFRFFLRRFRNGEETERLRGRARLRPEGGGTAELTEPEAREVELPADTLFPKSHTEAILDAARRDQRFLFAHVFDGTGEHGGLYAVNTVILPTEAQQGKAAEHDLLSGVPAWRTDLAFFPPEGNDGTPESEQSLRFYANGVAGSMRIDYGDFVIQADLSELEKLDRPQCR